MQGWAKELFAGTDRFLDVLNVGRLIFYSAAGLLALFPVAMIGHLIIVETGENGFFTALSASALAIDDPWLLLFGSTVTGFLIANVGFTTVIIPAYERVDFRLRNFQVSEQRITYRQPQLSNHAESQDYDRWLVNEYYRFIEIATYVPMGAGLGLACLSIYAAVYLLKASAYAGDPVPAATWLLAFATLFGALRFLFWPGFWVPRVVVPTVETCLKAQCSLTQGIEDWCAKKGAYSYLATASGQATEQPASGEEVENG